MSQLATGESALFGEIFPEEAPPARVVPFAYSVVAHAILTALLLIIPRVWVDEPDEKLITLSMNRHSKLIWYRLDTALPKLAAGRTRRKTAPEADRADPDRPLHARVRKAPKADQLIAQPDSRKTVTEDVETPNMAAFRQPAPEFAVAPQFPGAPTFVPPPAPQPTETALLLTQPVIEAARAAALPVYRDRFVAPPQPPEAPPQQLALDTPRVQTANETLPVYRNRFVPPPSRPVEQRQLALDAPTVETARSTLPGAPSAVDLGVNQPAKPQPKQFVPPSPSRTPAVAAQQLALNTPSIETARAELPGTAPSAIDTRVSGPAKPRPKEFIAPPSAGRPAVAAQQQLALDVPAIDTARVNGPGTGPAAATPPGLPGPTGELSALAASIRPAASGAVPDVSRPGSVSSGPEGRKGETRISGTPLKGGIEINTMPKPPEPVRLALIPNHIILPRAEAERRRAAVSLPVRLNAIPELVQRTLGTRAIYLVTVPAPNPDHYPGELMLWFAERQKAVRMSQDMHPPIAFRFTDPVSARSAAGASITGMVRLSGMLDQNGFVRSLQRIDDGVSDPRVNEAVLTAVAKWTFLPAARGYERMAVDIVMEIPLSLKAR